MASPQLSVRSAKAIEIAHRLARRDKRTIADIVETALAEYEARRTGREPASSFWRRVSEQYGSDEIDLEELIKEHRKPHRGIEL
jgi:hypothetical protein